MCIGYRLLRDPQYNKGLSFTEKEKDAHFLRGLLPPVVASQELQVKKMMHNIQQYQVPLQRYMTMMDLQIIVGEACQKYRSIFRQPQGSLHQYERNMFTPLVSSERFHKGMRIPVGKLSLY